MLYFIIGTSVGFALGVIVIVMILRAREIDEAIRRIEGRRKGEVE